MIKLYDSLVKLTIEDIHVRIIRIIPFSIQILIEI